MSQDTNHDKKQSELTDEDLQQVSGGTTVDVATQENVEEATAETACSGKHIRKEVLIWR
jgi:bacteriocin-like protein